MKKRLIAICLLAALLCSSVLTGCTDEKTKNGITSTTRHKELQNVEHSGQLPDALKTVVENNVFRNITAFDGKLMKSEICSSDEKNRTVTQKVQMLDIYGNELASYTVSSDDAYHATTLTATSDGGFLFVLGFRDYAYDQDTWASDNGFASRIIKCGKDGKLEFNTQFDGVEGSALDFCFEKEGKFYFFGTVQTLETNKQGIHSYTDIYAVVLNENGAVLKSKCIAGSDFDSLDSAEYADNGFVLSVSSQSDDGDFSDSNSNGYPVDWVITVNGDLEITEKERKSGRECVDTRIGEKEGITVHESDDLLKNFDAGTPTAFIDYGDFYLIVSENATGEYEKTPPQISSIWYYTETVYSGYDNDGNLLFRAAVDSSPDYDTMARNILNRYCTR